MQCVLLVDHEFEDIDQLADIYKVGSIPDTRVTIPAVKEGLITNAAARASLPVVWQEVSLS